jgi:tetratricopeptide (TPR) repeat protein
MAFERQRSRRRLGAALTVAAVWWAGAGVLSRAQDPSPSAAELFARYAAGDHAGVARALAAVEDYVAFRDEVVELGGEWDPRPKAALLLEAANAELRRVRLGVYRGGYYPGRREMALAPPNVWSELLDLSMHAARHVADDQFVRRWTLASLSLLEGEGEGTSLRASDLPGTRLTRQIALLGDLVDGPTRHMSMALAYEKFVWHGVTWDFPTADGKRSAATARVRGPIIRNFNKAVDRGIEELTAAMAFPEVRAEAEVRLGYVLAMRDEEGDSTTALDHFRLAREHGPSPDVLYLSHLFEGRVLEARPNAVGAISAYRAALEIKPNAQAARLGLAGLLFIEGRVDEAAALVEATLEEPDQLDDPWALYFYGRYGAWPERLAAMRETLR